nr:amidase family protein [Pigmentiphaga humi]
MWTLLGLPCVNVPGMTGPTGMPVGIQLVGRKGSERRLLAIAGAVHRIIAEG